MAELIAGDGTRFPIADTHVLVGRRSEDGKFRPDIDLADLAGGRTVSRRHLRLSKTDAGWVLRVEATARNATLLGGQPLARHAEAIVGEGAEITLGSVSLVFRGDGQPPASDANATLLGASQPSAELHA